MVYGQRQTCDRVLAPNTAPALSYMSSQNSSWLSQYFTPSSLPLTKAGSRNNNNNNKSQTEEAIKSKSFIRPSPYHARIPGRKWGLKKETADKINPDLNTTTWMMMKESKRSGKENTPLAKSKEGSGNVRNARPRQTSSQSPVKCKDEEKTPKLSVKTSSPLSSISLSSTFSWRCSPSPSFKKKHSMVPKSRNIYSPVVSRTKYENVLTKYYKTKKAVKYLMENFKIELSKNAFEEFRKEADALCEPAEKDEAESIVDNKQAQDQGTLEGNVSYTTHPLLRVELIQKLATTISEPALRPAVFQVPRKSPPDTMINMMETLSKSGKRCITCGKRFGESIDLTKQPAS